MASVVGGVLRRRPMMESSLSPRRRRPAWPNRGGRPQKMRVKRNSSRQPLRTQPEVEWSVDPEGSEIRRHHGQLGKGSLETNVGSFHKGVGAQGVLEEGQGQGHVAGMRSHHTFAPGHESVL